MCVCVKYLATLLQHYFDFSQVVKTCLQDNVLPFARATTEAGSSHVPDFRQLSGFDVSDLFF
jgi:hypothetical protein